ncbi:MAG: magnesium chelatase family protein [Actinomycetota bacterium]|jgi:magnesium chelatase family protein|nr:magnesium chelatase family protein [Actinomycetota bacterium]
MSLARAWSVALVGVQGHVVEIEADLNNGIPGLTMVGLPDAALAESRDRIKAAIINSGEQWPNQRITLALSPASMPKRGSSFDLGLAAGLLAANGAVPADALVGRVLLGELGLDGRVRGVPGVLPALLSATRCGFDRFVVPVDNLAEARLVPGASVIGVASLRSLVRVLRGVDDGDEPPIRAERTAPATLADLVDVAGQPEGRTAIEVAAAGGHHLFLLGPPGAGKTMLAERLPGILPPLSLEEALEVTAIHSVAGRLPTSEPLVRTAPYQDPHHNASVAAIVGGGTGIAKPGAACLAHRGVLFLDEAPEFASGVLDSLRQPLEKGWVSIARAAGTAIYPSRFSLVMAANPCPCARPDRACTCPPDKRRRYMSRLSGPLLDRVDLRVSIPRVTRAEMLAEDGRGEPSAAVAARVAMARETAAARYAGTPWRTNNDVPPTQLRRHWPVPRRATAAAEEALDKGQITARGYGRILRVAWTIADLQGVGAPSADQVGLALGYRAGFVSQALAA